jgi:hypothetical protein
METINAGEREHDVLSTPMVEAPHRNRRWMLWCGVLIVVAASLWYSTARSSGPTARATVADCTRAFEDSATPPAPTSLSPGVVGLGSVASIATFDTPSGWQWCFDGMGLATGVISQDQMQSAVDAPVAVLDGSPRSNDVLMLVHLGPRTVRVIVDSEASRSVVVAQGSGFEVLRISTAGWPHWRSPWSRTPVALGRILGYSQSGRVTSSEPFTWCPGSINTLPGQGC